MTTAKISLTRGQAEFFTSEARFPLFCAGYGAGKSHVMGLCAVRDAMHSSNTLIGLYEPIVDLLLRIAIPRVQYWLAEFGIVGVLNKQEKTILTSNNGVGDFIFKSMENIDTLIGYETYATHIDELDTLPAKSAEEVFHKLLGRNRLNPDDVPEKYKEWNAEEGRWECINRISAYTTPEGYRFCYKMWDPRGENAKNNPDFKLYRGKTLDNPKLTRAYIQSLKNTYPSSKLKAYMEGEFVNLASGTVYYNFDRDKHNTARTVLEKDVLHVGVDFNKGFTCGIVFVDDADRTSIVAEIVKQFDTPALIRQLKSRWPNNKIICYPDASGAWGTAFDGRPDANSIELLRQAGFEIRTKERNPRVENRVDSVVKLIEDGKFFVNCTACPEIASCLEQQAYDEKGQPDKKSGVDHPLDGMGYRINYSFPIRKPVIEIPIGFAKRV